jgi:hypothetical protein
MAATYFSPRRKPWVKRKTKITRPLSAQWQTQSQRAWPTHAWFGVSTYCNFAYSALACFRMGMSGSASFQRVRKSL